MKLKPEHKVAIASAVNIATIPLGAAFIGGAAELLGGDFTNTTLLFTALGSITVPDAIRNSYHTREQLFGPWTAEEGRYIKEKYGVAVIDRNASMNRRTSGVDRKGPGNSLES